MKYITKPRKKVPNTFKAKIWHKLEYKEKSFKDLDTRIHYPISSAYKGFSMLGGKSRKCRYAGLYN
jgi:hypothetical protein